MNAFDNGDGTHSIFGQRNGQILQSVGNDTMTGGGASERFVFTLGFGHDEVTDFYAPSPQHDTIDLSQTQSKPWRRCHRFGRSILAPLTSS